MKKYILGIIAVTVFFCCPLWDSASDVKGYSQAESQGEVQYLQMSGYTEEGIFYEVGEEKILRASGNSITVERKVRYEGKVIPNRTLQWTEKIGNYTYSGTLSLAKFAYLNGVTTATYQGTLYKQ